MIRDLADFSGLGLTEKAFETTDLNEILLNVCDRLSLTVREKKATINSEVLHTIRAIPGQVARLFYHLISNSLTYARPGVPPVIRVYSREMAAERVPMHPGLSVHRVYCEVCSEDNGIRIQPGELENIFDINPGKSAGEAREGLGLGLAQCRKIVRNHGGIIIATSEPGVGSTFSVVLPIE